VHLGHRQAVAGDADEAHKAFLARLDRRLEGAVCAQRGLPIDHVHQIVQLDRVDAVDPEAIERSADLLPRGAVGPLARLLATKNVAGLRRSQVAIRSSASP
jgi:hypothetical protein